MLSLLIKTCANIMFKLLQSELWSTHTNNTRSNVLLTNPHAERRNSSVGRSRTKVNEKNQGQRSTGTPSGVPMNSYF